MPDHLKAATAIFRIETKGWSTNFGHIRKPQQVYSPTFNLKSTHVQLYLHYTAE